MEGALTARQVVNEGDSSLATELQEETEENPSPVVDENNIVSTKKQGPSTHNWSGDWSFWISSSTYKDRNEEYKQQFTHLPDSEKLIAGTQSPPDAEKPSKRQCGETARASCGRDYFKEMLSHHYLQFCKEIPILFDS